MAIEIDRNPEPHIDAEITFGGLGDGWGSTSFEVKDGEIVDGQCSKAEFLNHCTKSIKDIKKVLDLIGIDGKQWIISQMTEDTPEEDRDGLEDAQWSGFRDANMVAKLTKEGDE